MHSADLVYCLKKVYISWQSYFYFIPYYHFRHTSEVPTISGSTTGPQLKCSSWSFKFFKIFVTIHKSQSMNQALNLNHIQYYFAGARIKLILNAFTLPIFADSDKTLISYGNINIVLNTYYDGSDIYIPRSNGQILNSNI